jgi:ribulose-phosphate 3-epimerase
MSIIIPAILEKDYDKVLFSLEKYSKINTKIQIDVCDGLYVSNKTWMPNNYEDINGYNLELEFDMMVNDVRSYLNFLYLYDAKYIIIHIACLSDLELRKVCAEIKSKNSLIKIGFAINHEDSLNRVYDNYNFFDYVQVMGIKEIGAQGQSFDKSILGKIKSIKDFFNIKDREENIRTLSTFPKDRKYIQIDGAMNPDTILICKKAGATSFAVGSYLKKSQDLNKDYANLSKI